MKCRQSTRQYSVVQYSITADDSYVGPTRGLEITCCVSGSSKQRGGSAPPWSSHSGLKENDTIEEFNVDSKAEYTLQLNLARVARN